VESLLQINDHQRADQFKTSPAAFAPKVLEISDRKAGIKNFFCY
jgi:hypothetical protein